MKLQGIALRALAVMLISTPHTSLLAQDNRHNLGAFPGPASSMRTGVGANVEIVIPLSTNSMSPKKEAWSVQFNAGPELSWNGVNDVKKQRRTSSFLQFSMRPQHSNKLNIAGHNIFTDWNRSVSAAERAADEQKRGGLGISDAGWVGILLGTAAVVGGILVLSSSDSCEVCDPANGPCLPQPC